MENQNGVQDEGQETNVEKVDTDNVVEVENGANALKPATNEYDVGCTMLKTIGDIVCYAIKITNVK